MANNSYSKSVTVKNREGIHARPSVKIVELASKYQSKLTISKEDFTADGKSILDVLTLAASYGTPLIVKAEGQDAKELVEEICKLIETEFSFPNK